MPNIVSEGGVLNNGAATAELRGGGLDGVAVGPDVRAGTTSRLATGSRPPPLGAVRSVGGWLTLREVRTAALPAAALAGVVTTAGAAGLGLELELVEVLLAEVLGVAAGVPDPLGSAGSVDSPPPFDSLGFPPPADGPLDSLGLPPPADGPPGVGPTRVGPTGLGATGEETVGVADGGGLLSCDPWPCL
jgi:hypothetical protein